MRPLQYLAETLMVHGEKRDFFTTITSLMDKSLAQQTAQVGTRSPCLGQAVTLN